MSVIFYDVITRNLKRSNMCFCVVGCMNYFMLLLDCWPVNSDACLPLCVANAMLTAIKLLFLNSLMPKFWLKQNISWIDSRSTNVHGDSRVVVPKDACRYVVKQEGEVIPEPNGGQWGDVEPFPFPFSLLPKMSERRRIMQLHLAQFRIRLLTGWRTSLSQYSVPDFSSDCDYFMQHLPRSDSRNLKWPEM